MKTMHMLTVASLKSLLGLSLVLAAFAYAGPARAANIALAPNGTPIMGYNASSNPSDLGTSYAGGEGIQNVNDGNLATFVDDFGNLAPYSYVGVTFSSPVNSQLEVTSLNLYIHTFGDGGWFGISGTGYNGNGQLDSSNLVAPIVQVTYDGTTWTAIAANDNYVPALTGTGPGSDAAEATFTLDVPVTGIEGIRLVGPNGGTATYQGNQGFIGVDEFQVEAIAAPEPSTYALLAGGLLCLVGLRRLRRA